MFTKFNKNNSEINKTNRLTNYFDIYLGQSKHLFNISFYTVVIRYFSKTKFTSTTNIIEVFNNETCVYFDYLMNILICYNFPNIIIFHSIQSF